MEIDLASLPAPRASATVVLLRDGADGLEVFLLKRHGLSDVLGGAYVFPGGKVDAEDSDDELLGLLDREPAQLRESLGEPELSETDAAALFAAALRETFEECGVLFVPDADGALASRAYAALREGRSFAETLGDLQLPLQASALAPWSRWITPIVGGVVRKRFDTRFFLARVPQGQEPRHDEREATESAWLTPRAALAQFWNREIELAPPQIMSLAHLSRHASVASAFTDARARKPPLVRPGSFRDADGAIVVCYPGDERHELRERALHGPTRLRLVGGRFEPLGGFDALFAD